MTQPNEEARQRVLIVDDDPVVRSLTRDALEDDGFDVTEAEDGVEACAICEQPELPVLIVSDVVMPRMDGFTLCRELRKRPETEFTPILVATGLEDHRSVDIAYEAGATDFITKPLNWLVLHHRIRYMLRAARAFDELRQNQSILMAAKEAAEAADRAKSHFLANMSHELRTPLNAVIGFASILRDGMLGPIDQKYAEYAKIIGDSGNHLLSIINDILDIAKAESQGLKLSEASVDIEEVIVFSATMVDEMAKGSQVAFSHTVEADIPSFWGDGKKLRQILINLLSNAIKFTPAGGSVKLAAYRDAGEELVIRISDSGIGIPADKMSVAMAPFGQVDTSLARKYDGVGLGLPLTKSLVELHGGIMNIASEPGRGTDVTVRLPRERFFADMASDQRVAG